MSTLKFQLKLMGQSCLIGRWHQRSDTIHVLENNGELATNLYEGMVSKVQEKKSMYKINKMSEFIIFIIMNHEYIQQT